MTIEEKDYDVCIFRQRPETRYGLRDSSKGSPSQRVAFPAQSSVLDEEALREHIVRQYDLPEIVSCRFFDRGDSDVYTLTAIDGRRFYLKIYRPPRSLELAEAEGQLTADLAARGFPAAAPVCRHDGAYATTVNASEGIRAILVWTDASQAKAGNDTTTIEAVSQIIGRLHNLTDSLPRLYDFPIDTAENIAELLPYAFEYLNENEANLVIAAANWGRETLAAWPRESPDFGLCHGDLAGVNIRSHSTHGIMLIDFGETRYTWRLRDFLRFHADKNASPKNKERWDAFRRGYSAVRTLPPGINEKFPTLRMMHHLGFMGGSSAKCPLRMGTESPEGFLPGMIQSLRGQVQGIPELQDHLASLGLLDFIKEGGNA